MVLGRQAKGAKTPNAGKRWESSSLRRLSLDTRSLTGSRKKTLRNLDYCSRLKAPIGEGEEKKPMGPEREARKTWVLTLIIKVGGNEKG